MSVTVVGSVALDTVFTPWGSNEDGLGGAATYFALAAACHTHVHLIGVVGDDFPPAHIEMLQAKGIDLDGLEHACGKTFHWTGRYHDDVNLRDTLDTELNVFEHFHPKLTQAARNAEYLFLGNIHPALQREVLEQVQAHFVALDTMNLWIDTALHELQAVLKRVDAVIINDAEARDLTGKRNLVDSVGAVMALGPSVVVVKKGEHGCLLFGGGEVFAAPAYLLPKVVDPTGAGDAFAGGFMGYLASQDATDFATLRRAVIHGSVVASYTCESFAPTRLAGLQESDIAQRYDAFRRLVGFW